MLVASDEAGIVEIGQLPKAWKADPVSQNSRRYAATTFRVDWLVSTGERPVSDALTIQQKQLMVLTFGLKIGVVVK